MLTTHVVFFFVLVLYHQVSHINHSVGNKFKMGEATLAVTAALLGQNVSSMKFLIHTSSRVLIGSWVLFSLIVSTAYTGNLIASLALPKSPERPETLEHLISAVNRCGKTMFVI